MKINRLLNIEIVGIYILCVFVSLFIILNSPNKYFWIFLLPISFGCCSILFNSVFNTIKYSFVAFILVSMMFFKNVIIPFFMSLGNGNFFAKVDTSTYMFGAVCLEIYEEIAVFAVIWFLSNKVAKVKYNFNHKKLEINNHHVNRFCLITAILFIVLFTMLIRFPLLIEYFSLGVSGDQKLIIQKAMMQTRMVNSVPTAIYYLFTILASFLRWAIPLCVIFKSYISNKGSEFSKILVSLIFILISAFVTNDTIAISFFLVAALVYLLTVLFPSQRKLLMYGGILSFIMIGGSALITKSFGSSGPKGDIQELVNMFQVYFSGPENVAVALSIPKGITVNEFVGNFLRFIPYVMHYFLNFSSSTVVFNYQFWGKSDNYTQIIPMISQGARTFSPILAPLFTILISYVAVKIEIIGKQKNDLFDYSIYIICGVCFAMSVGMYSASLCLQFFLNNVFILFVIKWSSKYIRM